MNILLNFHFSELITVSVGQTERSGSERSARCQPTSEWPNAQDLEPGLAASEVANYRLVLAVLVEWTLKISTLWLFNIAMV